jgi:hypothetical protein
MAGASGNQLADSVSNIYFLFASEFFGSPAQKLPPEN